MADCHSLLARQLKRCFGKEGAPSDVADFVEAVNDAYHQSDVDRRMLERALDLSSEELMEANTELRAIVQAFPDLFFRVDGGGRILECKVGRESDLVRPVSDLLGRRLQSVPDATAAERLERAFDAVRSSRRLTSVEYSLTFGDRVERYEARLSPLREDQVLATVRNVTQQRDAERKILHLAYYDDLTGLPNRVLLNDRLRLALTDARRNPVTFAVLFLDLDRFKSINDTLGHFKGDRLLALVANRLARECREGETLSRIAGDEFVLMTNALRTPEDATVVALRLIDALRKPFEIDGREFYLTTSIGVSTFPQDGDDAETLLGKADIAMYAAKERGRGLVQFYDNEMDARALERHDLENEIRRGMKRDEFLLHYQPQIDLATGRVVSAEALARWQRADGAMSNPAEFIAVAESAGLIVPLGENLLRSACRQAAEWASQSYRELRVAVNVSPLQLRQRNFTQRVASILEETGLDARSLELEITESAILSEPRQAAKTLRALREMGVGIALDDFGTGQSSLSHLRDLPISTVKLDQSFVRSCASHNENAAIIAAVLLMARSLGIRAVAEGVETLDELSFLRDRDCDEAQGFYFSRPVPAETFAELAATTYCVPSAIGSSDEPPACSSR